VSPTDDRERVVYQKAVYGDSAILKLNIEWPIELFAVATPEQWRKWR
jgi:hypothetical protein